MPGPWSLDPWSLVHGPRSFAPHPWSVVSGPRSLDPGPWCLVPCFLVLRSWYLILPLLVFGPQSLVPGSLVPGPWSLVLGPLSMVAGAWSLIPASESLVPRQCFLILGTWYLVPGNYSLVSCPGWDNSEVGFKAAFSLWFGLEKMFVGRRSSPGSIVRTLPHCDFAQIHRA